MDGVEVHRRRVRGDAERLPVSLECTHDADDDTAQRADTQERRGIGMALDTTVDSLRPAARIAANARGNLKTIWGFTVFWNAVSAPVLVYVPPELQRNPIAAIAFLFPAVGVGLAAWAILSTLRWRRFGETWLDHAAPAAPGAPWTATMHARLPRPEGPDGYTVVLRLSCLQRIGRGGDGERSDSERILWREEVELPSSRLAFGADDAAIPVRFDIPADAHVTTAAGTGEGVFWVLTAEAALPGANLKEDFDVLVRGGGPSDPPVRGPGSVVRSDPAIPLDDLARAGITVAASGDGTTFGFAAMRNMPLAAGVTSFTALWTGALWLQWFLGFPWIFPIVTGLFGLLLVWISLDLWLGTTAVVVSGCEVRIRHTVLGIGSTRSVAAAEITAIDLHIGMQTQGRFGTPYYDIRATLRNGRKRTLGGGIRNKRHAEWLAAQMRAALGMWLR
jgi:hypothetical protein